MTEEITMTTTQKRDFSSAFNFVKKVCAENQWAIGLGEMAVGAGLVAWGVKNGVIEMGNQLVASALADPKTLPFLGSSIGGGLGAIAGSIIGSIGIAGMGGAIGIPATLVAGGAAAVLGMAGYNATAIIQDIFTNSVNLGDFAANGSLLLVGVGLIVDGAQRIFKDQKIRLILSQFKEKSILLKRLPTKIVARNTEQLKEFSHKMKIPVFGMGSVVLGTCVGATTGSAIAASSVSILGSHSLGVAAVSMGFVSAPAWPVLAGIAGGAGLCFSAYKAFKCVGKRSKEREEAIQPIY